MADILPYLEVKRNYSETDAAARTIVLEDMVGMDIDQVRNYLTGLGITGQFIGDGQTVTGQIPKAGQSISGDSQVILYCGEEPEERMVAVPDFTGMTRQQASDAAGQLGLNILVSGNLTLGKNVTVTRQFTAKDTLVPVGTTIRLEFADTAARD